MPYLVSNREPVPSLLSFLRNLSAFTPHKTAPKALPHRVRFSPGVGEMQHLASVGGERRSFAGFWPCTNTGKLVMPVHEVHRHQHQKSQCPGCSRVYGQNESQYEGGERKSRQHSIKQHHAHPPVPLCDVVILAGKVRVM